jgi:hypothetical protein
MTPREKADIWESARQNTLSRMSNAFKEYQHRKSVCDTAGATRTGRSDSGSRISYTREQRGVVFDRKWAGGELDATIRTAKDVCGKKRVNTMLKQARDDYKVNGGSFQESRDEDSEEEQSHENGLEGSERGSSEECSSNMGGEPIEDIGAL